jgi:hypothetical protein
MTVFEDSNGIPRSDLFRRASELADKFKAEAENLNQEWHKIILGDDGGGSLIEVDELIGFEAIWRKAEAIALCWGRDQGLAELGLDDKKEDQPGLTDRVETIHRELFNESEKYRALVLKEVWAEGQLSMDEMTVTMMIRDKAEEMKINEVSDLQLAIIRTALHVILRRYTVTASDEEEKPT